MSGGVTRVQLQPPSSGLTQGGSFASSVGGGLRSGGGFGVSTGGGVTVSTGGALRSGGGLGVSTGGGFGDDLIGGFKSAGRAVGKAVQSADSAIRKEVGAPPLRGRSTPSKTKDTYHGLMKMGQHAWESVREAASQNLGHAPSAMWGKIPSQPFKGNAHHVRSVARAHSPHIAAKLLEAEHAQVGEGGGFADALTHLVGAVSDHVGGGFTS